MKGETKAPRREVKTPYAYRVVTKIVMPGWLTAKTRGFVVGSVFTMQLVTGLRLYKQDGTEVLEVEMLAPAEDERMDSISAAVRRVFERVQDLLREAEASLKPKKT